MSQPLYPFRRRVAHARVSVAMREALFTFEVHFGVNPVDGMLGGDAADRLRQLSDAGDLVDDESIALIRAFRRNMRVWVEE